MNVVFFDIFVLVYLWLVSILFLVSLFCLLNSKKLSTLNMIKMFTFYNDCFVEIMGIQEAWSLGANWLNTVVFLWILVI